jgi:predicted ribonuclease YlaK
MLEEAKLSKKQKRLLRQEHNSNSNKLSLKPIRPITLNQKRAFDAYEEGYELLLHGIAGTGKSFIAMYLGLRDVLEKGRYDNVTIVRSVVPTRDMGFMPGTQKEKAMVYEGPYYAMSYDLFGRGDGYERAKTTGLVNFITTSFIRGITINNSIIIVDEIQNMDYQELDSIITRVGKNCRIIFCGDFRQTDFRRDIDKEGLRRFMDVLDQMKSFAYVEFLEADIVRSDIVKDYIIAKTHMGY